LSKCDRHLILNLNENKPLTVMKIKLISAIFVGIVILLFIAGCQSGDTVDSKPNFIIILVDDLGYNDLGCFNTRSEGIITPNIDKLAKEGIRFTDWQSAHSICGPSRASILTGRYPSRCGYPVSSNPRALMHYENLGLNQDEVTIAELLKPLGYSTSALGKWHMGENPRFMPLRHGFDSYYGVMHNFDVGTKPRDLYEGDSLIGQEIYENIHDQLTERAIGIMKESKEEDKPFFIYLAHYLVHGPWEPGKEFTTEEEWEARIRYKGRMNQIVFPAMVRELDWHIGKLRNAIKELGLEENTVIFFLSDNGPWINNNLEQSAGSAWPLRGSKFNTFEGGHRVPAIISCPGRFNQGVVVDEMTSSMDIFPTITNLAGATLPSNRNIDGINLTPILNGKGIEELENRELLYFHATNLQAIRVGDWKLHLPRRPDQLHFMGLRRVGRGTIDSLDQPLLFNLSTDVEENKDIAKDNQDQVNELLIRAEESRKELGDWNITGYDEHVLPVPKDSIIMRPGFRR
jgi:arylsulfatase A-like enzyme